MTPEQQARLERAGWRTESVAEFLGLTPEEEARVERRVQEHMSMTDKAPSFRPAHDQILIDPIDASNKTAGGLFKPEGVEKPKDARGAVLSFGPGRLTPEGGRVAIDLKRGDVIVYPSGSYRDVEVDGRALRLVSYAALLGVIR